ncbi:MAG TPA: RNA-binding protein [Candidatus Saccharimonadia bacterium]|jgi:RNA recognition motif-containing protein|nr:RNA-binding protein [Candidatus Saccharimonadia bacterium]
MNNKLFVGSLSYNTTDEQLAAHFATAGTVVSAKVITDRDSGRSKGFGFVEMETAEMAQAAIQQLNGKDLDGRQLTVNVAKPQTDRPARTGGNFGGRPRY